MQWYIDLDGPEDKVVGRLNEIVRESATRNSGRILGGPYHPQTSSLLYLFEFPDSSAFQRSGKATLDRVVREGIAITPIRYEVAFECGENGGP